MTKLEHFSRRVLVQAHCILLNGSLNWRPSPPFETPHLRRQILPIGLFMLDSFSPSGAASIAVTFPAPSSAPSSFAPLSPAALSAAPPSSSPIPIALVSPPGSSSMPIAPALGSSCATRLGSGAVASVAASAMSMFSSGPGLGSGAVASVAASAMSMCSSGPGLGSGA